MRLKDQPFRTFFKTDLPRKEKKTKQQMWADIKKKSFDKMKKKNAPLNERDEAFQKKLWNAMKNHNCENCGELLGITYQKIFCNHILLKSDFPQLRYEEANINWYCRACHRNFHDNPSDKMRQVISDTKKYFGV